jgi:hypothetical protein
MKKGRSYYAPARLERDAANEGGPVPPAYFLQGTRKSRSADA